MPIIVSPRSRYIRSYDTSDGTVRVQLPQVNTQKLSSTTRPRSSASRRGLSLLSQLVLVSSGAGVPPGLGAGAGRRIAAVSPATIAVPISTDLSVVMLSTSLRVNGYVIVDNTATGATLEANGLVVVDELMRSSTRLYANPAALEDPARRRRVDDLVMLLDSVLVARRRVMLEVNASAECLEAVVAVLPSRRQATVAPLSGNGGYAVKAAVPRDALPQVIPAVKAAGGTDLVVSTFSQIVP